MSRKHLDNGTKDERETPSEGLKSRKVLELPGKQKPVPGDRFLLESADEFDGAVNAMDRAEHAMRDALGLLKDLRQTRGSSISRGDETRLLRVIREIEEVRVDHADAARIIADWADAARNLGSKE